MQRTTFKMPPVYILNKRFGGKYGYICTYTFAPHHLQFESYSEQYTVFKDKHVSAKNRVETSLQPIWCQKEKILEVLHKTSETNADY